MLYGKHKCLGVFINKTDNFFLRNTSEYIDYRARELGFNTVFFSTVGYRNSFSEYDRQERRMFDFAPLEDLDGIIVVPDTYQMLGMEESLLYALKTRAKCPVVGLRNIPDYMHGVVIDESTAIGKVVCHLIEHHGLKKISFMAGYHGHHDSERRIECYRKEMEAHGLEVKPESIFYADMWCNMTEQAYKHFFIDNEKPEAIVCANDYMALSLMYHVMEMGYSIPRDVVITGFDDIANSDEAIPTLTSVGRSYDKMAYEAVNLIDRLIKDNEHGVKHIEPCRVYIPTEVKYRESCGCGCVNLDDYILSNRKKFQTIEYIELIHQSFTYFFINLCSCTDFSQLTDMVELDIEKLYNYRDFYVFLYSDDDDDHPLSIDVDMLDHAKMVMGFSDQKRLEPDTRRFDRRELLPESVMRDEPQTYYVMLLHHGTNSLGYSVVQYEQGHSMDAFYLQWNASIASVLNNMYNRSVLMKLLDENRIKSITDPMTGLYNRRGLSEKLTPWWEGRCDRGETVTFISIDLDGLKRINDSFGHAGGDKAIIAVGKAMNAAKTADSIAARVGGDEFIVFLPKSEQSDADGFIERFNKALDEINGSSGYGFSVGASAGAYVKKLDYDSSIEECIRQCDLVMYKEKRIRYGIDKKDGAAE